MFFTSSKKLRENHRGREIHAALESLGGVARLSRIVRAVIKGRRARGEEVPINIDASVRNGLQRHCSTSPHYGGHDDWFRNPKPGVWELVSNTLSRERRLQDVPKQRPQEKYWKKSIYKNEAR